MQLQKVSLSGKRFYVQFIEIMTEFGRVIPWLDGLDDLRFATNGAYFREKFLLKMRQEVGGITPYQLVLPDRSRSFLGGLLHFERSPEAFKDTRNIELQEQLTASGANFISCLQVRNTQREHGFGQELVRRSIKSILEKKGPVWGVVSDLNMLNWYRSLGASTPSPLLNRDHLWIVHWKRMGSLRL